MAKTTSPYTDTELREALQSLLNDSDDPQHDGRHLRCPSQELSMLQIVTATRILDYRSKANGVSLAEMEQQLGSTNAPVLDLYQVIVNQSPRMALAAEFKRASPSKGLLVSNPDDDAANAAKQAVIYATAGASIISILTEERWFLGSLQDLSEARAATESLPIAARPAILRKDFLTSPLQIAEAVLAGADTVLLIVAVLPQSLLQKLIEYCRHVCHIEPLVEVHADAELEVAIQAGARVIGVNNRNLHTFQLDLATTEHIAQLLTEQHGISLHHRGGDEQPRCVLAALSGMSNAYDVDRYRKIGVGMCLIGESLMRAADPAAAIAGLCLHPDDFAKLLQQEHGNFAGNSGAYVGGTKLIKVCGITNPDDALVACQAGANLIGIIFVPKSPRFVSSVEQASAIVTVVRAFGERQNDSHTARLPLELSSTAVSHHFVAAGRALLSASRRQPLVVGVFQNQPPEYIADMVQQCRLDLVQLHGSEGMAAANPSQCGGVPAIRVVDIMTTEENANGSARKQASPDAASRIVQSLTSDPIAILLDTSIQNGAGGGTGVTFDWSIARQVQDAGIPVIIAGGLKADNIAEAVTTIGPFGVDVSSGVEKSPGQKDHDKVRSFCAAARASAAEANKGF
jgi:indole-3-glycerol phosphate synthase/phosphoribosylanthranilate isomerase